MKVAILITVIALLQCSNAQDVHMTEQVIKSIQLFTNGIVYKQNATLDERMDATLTGFINNAEKIKDDLSLNCTRQLTKLFGPAIAYINNKNYTGLIKWLFDTGNIYCMSSSFYYYIFIQN